jgi:hypothetical protein
MALVMETPKEPNEAATLYYVDDLPQRTRVARMTVREILKHACVLGAEVDDVGLVLVELREDGRHMHEDPQEHVALQPGQRFVTAQR